MRLVTRPPQPKQPREGHASRGIGVAACLGLAGCQLVFGLNDYAEDAPSGGSPAEGGGGAAPVVGAGGMGAGGEGTGAGEEGGAPPGCDCDIGAIWKPMALASRGAGTDPVPTQCNDASAPLVGFIGAPTVECAACACDVSGCEVPDLECHDESNCADASPRILEVGSSCVGVDGGCRSYRPTGDVTPVSCTAEGGALTEEEYAFAEYLAFCEHDQCLAGCVGDLAPCIVAEGIPAGECPNAFPNRYVVAEEGTAVCESCSCEATCDGPVFGAGVFNCNDVDVGDDGCTSPLTFTFQVRATKNKACSTNHDAAFAGTFELSGEHTVCCRQPIEPLQ